MYLARELAYNKKEHLISLVLSVAVNVLFLPNSYDELGNFVLY